MDDSLRFLLDEFVAESKEHLATLEEDMMTLERTKDNPEPELVNRVFRAIHTIKGTSGFFGFERITELSHTMENILSMIRSGEMTISNEIIDNLLTGIDFLSAMIDNAEGSNETDITDINLRLKRIAEKNDASVEAPKAKEKSAGVSKLKDNKGRTISFDVEQNRIKDIYGKNCELFYLDIDLIELAKNPVNSPVKIFIQLSKIGEVIEAKMDIEAEDLLKGIPTDPLSYKCLFFSELTLEAVQESLPSLAGFLAKVDSPFADLSDEEIANLATNPANSSNATEQVTSEPEEIVDEDSREIESSNIAVETKPEKIVEIPAELLEGEALVNKIIAKSEELAQGSSVELDTKRSVSALQSKKAPTDEADKGKTESVNSVRISIEILDDLMRLASELVLVRNQQLRNFQSNDSHTRNILQRLDIVTTDLQEKIMLTRMQPIGNIFNKFQRVVRELAKKLGKHINISITGSEVELDKTILEALTDPLTHIIRNSCDHGVETPQEREAKGKLPTGSIMLNAWHEGGQINIEIIDDGKGIDPAIIKKKVVEKGLKTVAEVNAMTDKEIVSLVMLAGFSTAEKVSDISGRGVGMDVVRAGIEKLNGSIDIESEKGYGTQIRLRLPLTLAIIPCLVVSVDGIRYAIPQVNLEELVSLYNNEAHNKIECAGDREVYRLRDILLPMVRLDEVLARPKPFTEEVIAEISDKYHKKGAVNNIKKSTTFAVLKVGERRFGLIVDEVLGTEEIVVKPMHSVLKDLHIYSGTTVMGDGRVALILDVEGLLKHTAISDEISKRSSQIEADVHEEDMDEKQTLLLFKSGLSETFAIALPLIKRIERIQTKNIERLGEHEFVTINGASTRVLRLDKVLSVSPFDQNEEAFLLLPKFIKRPFGILASKLVDIEEKELLLNTESYMQDGLLGTAILRNHMTLFIDIYRLIEISEPDWFDDRKKAAPVQEEVQRILVVEDSSFFRELIKGYLESDGYDITPAVNGAQALKFLEEKEFDIVVSDIEMPVMDGFELIKIIRSDQNFSHLPAIALTSLDNPVHKERAMKLGFDRYEVKLEREKFLSTLAEMIELSKTRVKVVK